MPATGPGTDVPANTGSAKTTRPMPVKPMIRDRFRMSAPAFTQPPLPTSHDPSKCMPSQRFRRYIPRTSPGCFLSKKRSRRSRPLDVFCRHGKVDARCLLYV
jgi:hypothetical protein